MTLIVGIKCKDGIILGADAASTYMTADGQLSIKQATSKKLKVIHNKLVLGVSGPVGLGQSYEHDFDSCIKSSGGSIPWKDVESAKKKLREMMWEQAQPLWDASAIVSRAKNRADFGCVAHSSVIALPVKNKDGNEVPYLMQFDDKCAPEEASDNLPFLSIGSGQKSADTFLAFLRRILFPHELPSIADGTLTAIWTLQYAIHAEPYGLAHPIQIVTLEKDAESGKWKAKEMDDSGMQEHQGLINEAEQQIKNIRANIANPTAEAAPEPPPSPPPGS